MQLGPFELGLWEGVGYLGHALFFTRFFIQWIVSEKKKESVVPISFWFCSVVGSLLALYYSIHIQDPVFIVGMSISFLIAIRNLMLIYQIPLHKRPLFWVAAAIILASFYPVYRFGTAADEGLVWLGFVGQAIFTARFVIQWIVSEKKNRSVMPATFWYCSIIGGGIRLIYAVDIGSLVFILGNGVGLIVYARNLMLIYRKKKVGEPPMSKAAKSGETFKNNSST